MNIFALHQDPVQAAQWHVDDHVSKMIIKSAQMLSTAHRLFDGTPVEVTVDRPDLGLYRKRLVNIMPGEVPSFTVTMENIDRNLYMQAPGARWYVSLKLDNNVCCMHTHENHPCNIWVRKSTGNYQWLFELYKALAAEFLYRHGKPHEAWLNWNEFLAKPPANLQHGPMTEFAAAMPEKYFVPFNDGVIEAYHRFYVGDKYRFARWTKREMPSWYEQLIPCIFYDDELEVRRAYLSNPKFAAKTWVTLEHF
jgi:hypothetical protein